MLEAVHALRLRLPVARLRRGAGAAVIHLLLAAGLSLISPSPSVAQFPYANRIVVVCSLLGEPPLTTKISADEFCEIAKTAIESLARGKIGPRVARLAQWQRELEAIWPKAYDENRPPDKAADYCYPTARDLNVPRPYLRVTIERLIPAKYYSDPTALVIQFRIRGIKNASQETLIFSYNIFFENGVASEKMTKHLQRIPRWPGAVVISTGTVPTQELFDEIQVTLAAEFTPFVLNRINSRAEPP